MRQKIDRFLRSGEWTGFIATGWVVIFLSAFLLMIIPYITTDTKAMIYSALIIFFTSVVGVDLTIRCVRLGLSRLHGTHRIEPYQERCARALRDKWVAIKLDECSAGREIPEDHLIMWEDLDDRNKNIDRSLASAVVDEYRQWRAEQL